jgi:hypothetical protein
MGNIQKLRVWQLAKDLAVKIYKLTQSPVLVKDFGFKDQIQRSAVSIPSNIAEGDELDSNKKEADLLINDCKLISVMLTKLIRTRSIN